jgi:hemoglobin
VNETRIEESSIKCLIDRFYGKVNADPQLAPVFQAAIGSTDAEWQPHLRKMYAFWGAVMLNRPGYRGNPFQKHKDLPAFDPTLFDRWLALFAETAHEVYVPEIAARYIDRSQMIAAGLKAGLYPLAG